MLYDAIGDFLMMTRKWRIFWIPKTFLKILFCKSLWLVNPDRYIIPIKKNVDVRVNLRSGTGTVEVLTFCLTWEGILLSFSVIDITADKYRKWLTRRMVRVTDCITACPLFSGQLCLDNTLCYCGTDYTIIVADIFVPSSLLSSHVNVHHKRVKITNRLRIYWINL